MSRFGWVMVAVLAACNGDDKGDDGFVTGATAEVTDIPEVVRATWSTTDSADAYVRYGWDGECDAHETPTSTGTDHQVLLMGLPSSTEVCWTVVATDANGDEHTSDGAAITTGAPQQGVALPTIDIDLPDGYDEPYISTANILPPSHLVIDRQGHAVWSELLDDARQTVNLVQLDSRDGFTYSDFNKDHSIDDSWIRTVSYDGAITAETQVPSGHHAYHFLDDGTIQYLAVEVRQVDGWGDVVGDVIQEVAPDGTVTERWNAWNDYDKMPIIDEDADGKSDEDNGFYPQGVDWTHADNYEYSAERDSFLLSFRNVDMILEVDAASGAWKRSIGWYGTYTLEDASGNALDPKTFISHPHNATYLPNGNILVMTMSPTGGESHVVELEITSDNADGTGSAKVVWDWTSDGDGPDGVDAKVEGAGERLANGNTLVNWGAGGILQEVTQDYQVVWQASFGTAAFAGHAHALEGFYPE